MLRSLLLCLVAGAALAACAAGPRVGKVKSADGELASSALDQTDGAAVSDCDTGGGPPTDCIPKGYDDCYHIDEPEFTEVWNLLCPPGGSVRPPPDCWFGPFA
jgi:hypothetical protein